MQDRRRQHPAIGFDRDLPARAAPPHPRHRRVQPNVQPLAQPAPHEGADAALRHQVAAAEDVPLPVQQAEVPGVGRADHRAFPAFHRPRPGVVRQRPRHRAEWRIGIPGRSNRSAAASNRGQASA